VSKSFTRLGHNHDGEMIYQGSWNGCCDGESDAGESGADVEDDDRGEEDRDEHRRAECDQAEEVERFQTN